MFTNIALTNSPGLSCAPGSYLLVQSLATYNTFFMLSKL